MSKKFERIKDQLEDAIMDSYERRISNTGRYTGDGHLKPVCAQGEHLRFMGSLLCTRCGSRLVPLAGPL